VHVEAVGEGSAAPSLHVGVRSRRVDVGLQLVGRQHHHHVGPLGGLGDVITLRPAASAFLAEASPAQRDDDVLDAGIAQVQRMGVALAAIADDGDLLALDQVESASRS
jgi:hypothetical protein